jgi:hypothetical protein
VRALTPSALNTQTNQKEKKGEELRVTSPLVVGPNPALGTTTSFWISLRHSLFSLLFVFL